MKKLFRKVTAVITLVCMLMVITPAAYASIAYGRIDKSEISSSFKDSPYCTRAQNAYRQCNNFKEPDADRFVEVAKSQIGYKASPTKSDFNGDGSGVIGSGKPHTEYSRYMGVDGKNWCASYVSWVAAAAGISKDVIVPGAGCGHFRNASPNGGKLKKLWSSDFKTYYDYKPRVGDIVLYTGTCSKCGKYSNTYKVTGHVGIVTSVSNTKNADGSWTFTTVERTTVKRSDGKKVDTVGEKTRTTKQTRGSGVSPCKCNTNLSQVKLVQGFFHPNWADGKLSVNDTVTANDILDKTGESGLTNNTGSTSNNNTSSGSTANNSTSSGSTANNTSTGTVATPTPGKIDHSNTNYITTSKGSIAWATDSTYLNKQYVNGTNATLVANIKKKAGTHLNYTAIIVYDSNWNVLADKQFTNTNVSDSNTNFHAWFNMKNDLGITLKPSSKYYYRIYAKVDGEKIASPHWNFTTASK